MPFPIGVHLKKDASGGILGCVSGNGKWFVEIREGQDWLF